MAVWARLPLIIMDSDINSWPYPGHSVCLSLISLVRSVDIIPRLVILISSRMDD